MTRFLLALTLLLGAASATFVYPTTTWNIRRLAQTGACCTEFENMCEIRDLKSCEAFNECRESGYQISCETLEDEPKLRTKLFEYVCAEEDSCADELDTMCDGEFDDLDLCKDHASCVLDAVTEDGENVDKDLYMEAVCADTGGIGGGDANMLWVSAAACGEVPCLEVMKDSCADPSDEGLCKTALKCIERDFDESSFVFDEETSCDCNSYASLDLYSGSYKDSLSRKVCKAEIEEEEDYDDVCEEVAEYINEEFFPNAEGDDKWSCPEVEEFDAEVTNREIKHILHCDCRRSTSVIAVIGAGVAGVALIGGAAAAVFVVRGGMAAGRGDSATAETKVEKGAATSPDSAGDSSEVSAPAEPAMNGEAAAEEEK